jgi:hypothetical protein
MLWHEIRTIDGRTISRTHTLRNRWEWILDVISQDAGCDPDEIDIVETEDGDIITVDGHHYARVVISSFGGA